MRVGLFFGSFNPVHTGHLVIAEYILEFYDIAEIWMVVSPQNPLKDASTLASEEDRVEMVGLALTDVTSKVKLCDAELHMPKPSFTIDTLKYLGKQYPNDEFVIIMGSDGVETLSRWKAYDELINGWDFYVYPRSNSALQMIFPSKRFTLVDAPILGISSTKIRELIASGTDAIGYVPNDVWDYICKARLYGCNGKNIMK